LIRFPVASEVDGKADLLYPHVARLRNLTYAAGLLLLHCVKTGMDFFGLFIVDFCLQCQIRRTACDDGEDVSTATW
jgi:hypothetical protein